MTTQQQQGQHGTERSASEARSAGAVRSVPPLSNTGINNEVERLAPLIEAMPPEQQFLFAVAVSVRGLRMLKSHLKGKERRA